jgi:hypothetical protein
VADIDVVAEEDLVGMKDENPVLDHGAGPASRERVTGETTGTAAHRSHRRSVTVGPAAIAVVQACTRHVRYHRFWRLVYRLLATPTCIGLGRRWVRRVRRRRGTPGVDALLGRLGDAFVWSGWPAQSRGWVNLDVSRFLARLEIDEPRPSVRRAAVSRPPQHPLRVGCVGHFSVFPGLAPQHFKSVPEGVVLIAFDTRMDRPRAVAEAIDDADLDLVLLTLRGREARGILELLSVPCVAVLCSGSDLVHHDSVDFSIYPQPEPDYFVRDNRLFCATSRTWFGQELVFDGWFPYDGRGLNPERRAPWCEREAVIVVHGSLFKAASQPFLAALFSILQEDRQLDLVLMGKDSHGALERIQRATSRAGMTGQVHYEGMYSSSRSAEGRVGDAGWTRLRGHLARARLAPDPWPLGGGGTRVEAYGAGVPAPHLSVSFDPSKWGRSQDSIAEVVALEVASAAATSVPEYAELCRACLYDEGTAQKVSSDQADVFFHVTDAQAFWSQVVRTYLAWYALKASAHGHG